MNATREAIEKARPALYEYSSDELALWLWCNRAWFESLEKPAQDYIVRDTMGRVGSTVVVMRGRVVKIDKRLGVPGLVERAARQFIPREGLDLFVDKGNSYPCVVYVGERHESPLGFFDKRHHAALVLRGMGRAGWSWRPLWGLRIWQAQTAQRITASQMDALEILCRRVHAITGGFVRPAPQHDHKWDYNGRGYAAVPEDVGNGNRPTTRRWQDFCWDIKKEGI